MLPIFWGWASIPWIPQIQTGAMFWHWPCARRCSMSGPAEGFRPTFAASGLVAPDCGCPHMLLPPWILYCCLKSQWYKQHQTHLLHRPRGHGRNYPSCLLHTIQFHFPESALWRPRKHFPLRPVLSLRNMDFNHSHQQQTQYNRFHWLQFF